MHKYYLIILKKEWNLLLKKYFFFFRNLTLLLPFQTIYLRFTHFHIYLYHFSYHFAFIYTSAKALLVGHTPNLESNSQYQNPSKTSGQSQHILSFCVFLALQLTFVASILSSVSSLLFRILFRILTYFFEWWFVRRASQTLSVASRLEPAIAVFGNGLDGTVPPMMLFSAKLATVWYTRLTH